MAIHIKLNANRLPESMQLCNRLLLAATVELAITQFINKPETGELTMDKISSAVYYLPEVKSYLHADDAIDVRDKFKYIESVVNKAVIKYHQAD